MVIQAVSVGEVEPRGLRPLEVGQPSLTGLAPAQQRTEFLLVPGGGHAVRHPLLHGQPGKAHELVVRPKRHDVDPGDHPGDRLIGDVGERLSADLVEGEVGPVAEMDELEVVVADSIEPSRSLS